jgi:hypothetical protein
MLAAFILSWAAVIALGFLWVELVYRLGWMGAR